jgi:crotonobetainyl-CoA:carnitine CoA-transferase CaiB-like acyl-CoA transferase
MRPLDDVSVVSLGQIYNGPYCALVLAYLGADVVKVEPPGGENIRSRDEEGMTPELVMLNSSKDSVVLDLKDDRGTELFRDLVREADVLVENYSTGTMDRLDLGYEALAEINPELIYASGSGYGESGPYTDYPAMDLTVQAMTGVMDVNGFPDNPPVKTGVQVADFMGGTHLAAAVLAALHQRDRTGEGQFVEVGMMEAVYPTLLSPMAAHYSTPDAPHRTGNRHSGLRISPYNVYEASDGYVAIICNAEHLWERLAGAIDRPELAEDPDFDSNEKRRKRMDEVDAIVEEWTTERTRDDAVDTLRRAGVPCAPVQTREEVLYDEHLEARGMIQEVEHPEAGTIRVPGLPMKLHGAEEPRIDVAEAAGASSREVLGELGITETELDRLEEAGVI